MPIARLNTKKTQPVWKVRSLSNNYIWEGTLIAYWEVDGDPISGEYTPKDISAEELLRLWAGRAEETYPTKLIPIEWYAVSEDQGKFERVPFQYLHEGPQIAGSDDFLSSYTWPIDTKTNAPLNWFVLPVADKEWNDKHSDKGGFFQTATGWKPSILQPFVYLPSLLNAVRL